ncbi:hypothetical protein [Methylorubrum extorquens]|nr:hypothetical protein [Methylorubrum extorquens]MCP1545644.1 hypothetical protein [Methylorubrum extorquens]MCP1591595.1 hypothetical protein [Methylorubrum extorquens]
MPSENTSMDQRYIPPGDFLIECDGLGLGLGLGPGPGRYFLRRANGETHIVDGALRVLTTIRFDTDFETLAIFIYERPSQAGGARLRGRRLAGEATPDELLAAFLDESLAAAA